MKSAVKKRPVRTGKPAESWGPPGARWTPEARQAALEALNNSALWYELSWHSYTHAPEEQRGHRGRLRSIARILKATVLAHALDDDDALEALEGRAKAYLDSRAATFLRGPESYQEEAASIDETAAIVDRAAAGEETALRRVRGKAFPSGGRPRPLSAAEVAALRAAIEERRAANRLGPVRVSGGDVATDRDETVRMLLTRIGARLSYVTTPIELRNPRSLAAELARLVVHFMVMDGGDIRDELTSFEIDEVAKEPSVSRAIYSYFDRLSPDEFDPPTAARAIARAALRELGLPANRAKDIFDKRAARSMN